MQLIHGLNIEADVRLPGLAQSHTDACDVTLSLHESLPPAARSSTVLYRASAGDADDAAVEILEDTLGVVHFRYSDGTAIDVDARSHPVRVDGVVAPGQTIEDFAAYFYGPVLGFVLRARRRLALHASSVVVDGGAVLFVGPHGSGKSTLAAAFAEQGHCVLSDDLTAIEQLDHCVAHAAFDHVRLWSGSEQILFGERDVLARITPTWDKRRYPLTSAMFRPHPAPVSLIVLLGDDAGAHDSALHAVAPTDALLALAANTYANYLHDAGSRARELEQLGALVRDVRVNRAAGYHGSARLDAFVRFVTDAVRDRQPIQSA